MENNTENLTMSLALKKVMLTDLKTPQNLLLTSQRMHQNEKISCVIAF